LGGSLADTPILKHWLRELADHPVIIVPGGGPFADQVRLSQARWRFDDRIAHTMAILAMAQYGLMFTGLCPRLASTSDISKLGEAVASGKSIVWLPDWVSLDIPEIPASWAVTSDSLAAWLARRCGAQHLLLVKAAPVPSRIARLRELVDEGIIDSAFGNFTIGSTFNVWLCHAQEYGRSRTGLGNPNRSFCQLLHEK
jgi:aspartokinase-like uncharacterized kinase